MERGAATVVEPGRQLGLHELLNGLARDGLITQQQARDKLAQRDERSRDNRHPLVVIAESGWHEAGKPERKLSLDTLLHWLAGQVKLPFHRIDPLSIDVASVTSLMSYPYATRNGVLPVKVTSSEIMVATCQPYLRGWEYELEHTRRRSISRVIASPVDIERYQVEFYALARSVKASSAERGGEIAGTLRNLEQLVDIGRTGEVDAKDQHVVRIVDWLLQYAFEQRASDIHLEPRRDMSLVRFRIDGVLHQVYQLPTPVMAGVTSRIKILSRMDVAEKRRPQDGRIKTRAPGGKEVELRVSSLPTAFGEKMVMRIFDPEVLVKDFSQLGFTPTDSAQWEGMIQRPDGIILVTGPTGSGKTTTLYSTLKQLATPDVNVCTIEDPIELVEPAFNQMQVQANISLDFAGGVRALLRQDPDIIMIGEIRDLETAEIAIQAALTGHLVLSTLHTNDAPTAITRLLDLGTPPYLLKDTLLGVVAQRLVRVLCPHCRQPVEPDDKTWQDLTSGWPVARPKHIYEPAGCLECRASGYFGRTGIYEIMSMTPSLRTLISEQADLALVRKAALRQGMSPLRISGAEKIAAGVTSVDEVVRVAPPAPSARPGR